MESHLDDILGHFDHSPMHLLGGDGGVRVVQYIDAAKSILVSSVLHEYINFVSERAGTIILIHSRTWDGYLFFLNVMSQKVS